MLVILVYILILLALVIAVIRRPAVAIGAILCIFGLEQWSQSASDFFTIHGQLTNFSVGGILVLALCIIVVRGEPVFSRYPRLGWLVLSLFAYAFVSILWSPSPDLGMDVWANQWPHMATVIVLSPLVLSTPDKLRSGFMALLPLGTALILLLLFSSHWSYRGVELATGNGGPQIVGNPLAVAEMAGFVMLSVVLLNFTGVSRLWQWARWFIAAICLAIAVKTGSRGQFFTMLVVAIAFLPFSRRIARPTQFFLLVAGAVVLGAIGLWAFDYLSPAGGARWDSAKMVIDVAGRYHNAFVLLAHWYRDPAAILPGLGNTASYDPRIIGFYPHVVPIEILGEEGLIGAALFVTIIVLTYRSLLRTRKLVLADRHRRGALAALGAMFTFELLLCFKQGSLVGSTFLFFFAIMIGKYEVLILRETRKRLMESSQVRPSDIRQVARPQTSG